MNGAATDGLAPPPADLATGSTPEIALEHAAQNIPDVDEAARAAAGNLVGPDAGRLAEIAGWLAATQGRTPPADPRRPRCVVVGETTSLVHTLANSLQVGVHQLPVPGSPSDALRAGIAAADGEIDAGADLVVLVAEAGKTDPAPATLVSVLRGVEPVALLPRGSAAVDSGAWSQHAARVRDLRRAVLRFRARPEQLLAELGSPALSATAGFLLRATARRTPIILGGTLPAVAALFVSDIAPHAVDWWQAADASPDPAQARAFEELGLRPILALGIAGPSATAGLLTLPVLRAAAEGCA